MHVRSLFAVVIAALLIGPVAAHAATKAQAKAAPATTSSSSFSDKLSIGGWIGYETDDLSGVQLRAEGSIPYQKLTPQIELSWVGSLGYSYLSKSTSAFGVSADTSANILKAVPAARFTYTINPQFSVFGDAGLGLYWESVKATVDLGAFGGKVSASDSSVGFMLRFGVGAFYALNRATRVGVMFDLDPMFGGKFDGTTRSFLAGVTYKL